MPAVGVSLSVPMAERKKPDTAFAARFVEAMERAAITPAVIVKEVGVDYETVRLWRKGERVPNDERMKVLAKLLGRSASHLRYGEDDSATPPPDLVVKDDDERMLLETYRHLPEWGKRSLRARAAELLENFAPASPENPYGKKKTPGTQ
jgi:transcriptional regulator with XRE-family HTH domain